MLARLVTMAEASTAAERSTRKRAPAGFGQRCQAPEPCKLVSIYTTRTRTVRGPGGTSQTIHLRGNIHGKEFELRYGGTSGGIESCR